MASAPSATASMLSVPPAPTSATAPATALAPATVTGANPGSGPNPDDHLAAQLLIALSPSLNSALGGANSTVATTSNTVSTASAISALSTGATSSSTTPSGSLASSNLPLPTVELASQFLTNPAPNATSTGFASGVLPQNVPEPQVLNMLSVLVIILALRQVCERGILGFRWTRAFSMEESDGDFRG